MATRTVKCDSGNDLKLQNNGGTGSVNITDAGDLTIDSPADIVLDAEGADITLKDGGTTFGSLKQASGHLVIQPTSSKEIILNDQGGTAALTVDIANQNVSINNGNIVMGTAGKGIDFAAQTVSSATGTTPDTSAGDEVLDHYETGGWTGVVTSTGNPMTMHASYGGTYTRIGNLVTVMGFFLTTNIQSATGQIFMTGLPFAVPSGNPSTSGGGAGYGENLNLGAAGQSVSFYAAPSTSNVYLFVWDATTGATTMQASEWPTGGGIVLSFSYRTS